MVQNDDIKDYLLLEVVRQGVVLCDALQRSFQFEFLLRLGLLVKGGGAGVVHGGVNGRGGKQQSLTTAHIENRLFHCIFI